MSSTSNKNLKRQSEINSENEMIEDKEGLKLFVVSNIPKNPKTSFGFLKNDEEPIVVLDISDETKIESDDLNEEIRKTKENIFNSSFEKIGKASKTLLKAVKSSINNIVDIVNEKISYLTSSTPVQDRTRAEDFNLSDDEIELDKDPESVFLKAELNKCQEVRNLMASYAQIEEDFFGQVNELKQSIKTIEENTEAYQKLQEELLISKKKCPLDKKCKSEGNILGRLTHQVIHNCPIRKQELEQLENLQRDNQLLLGQFERMKSDHKMLLEN
ncbi:unnamed protein product, partial [Brachionus calyciflorus]